MVIRDNALTPFKPVAETPEQKLWTVDLDCNEVPSFSITIRGLKAYDAADAEKTAIGVMNKDYSFRCVGIDLE